MRWTLLATVALAACSVRADWNQGFRCDDGVCPAGETCVDGVCAEGPPPADATLADGPGVPVPDGPAPVVDAAVAPPDAAPLPPNLIPNPGAEDGVTFWEPWQANLSITTNTPHEGVNGLKVCKDATAPTDHMSVYNHAVNSMPVEQGARYAGWVWVRASMMAGELPPPILYASLRENGGAADYRDEDSPAVTGLTTDWVRLDVELTVTEPDRTFVELHVWPSSTLVADGTCYVVDDAYVYRAE